MQEKIANTLSISAKKFFKESNPDNVEALCISSTIQDIKSSGGSTPSQVNLAQARIPRAVSPVYLIESSANPITNSEILDDI